MPTIPRPVILALVAAIAGCASGATTTGTVIPTTVAAYRAGASTPLTEPALIRELATADFLLLGEVHDNPVHHETRARLLTALRDRHPAVVFEQFAASDAPLARPPSGADTAWLDRAGFDRKGWRWPLHRPVVEAAVAVGRSIWGSNLPRESLSGAIRNGPGALPEPLQRIMAAAPADSAVRATMIAELVAGHCGQLPASMAGGMRTAQEARDAAMAKAMLAAGADGPVVLIAGNGHVRGDVAVPRILRRLALGKRVLAVGLIEAAPNGAMPDSAAAGFDLILVTPRTERPDPCAAFRGRN